MDFDALTPELVFLAVEQAFDLRLDGTITPYPSYINRVYGVRTDEGEELIAKFYRPGRWSEEAIADEHEFVLDCSAADVPVVAPLGDEDGDTLHELVLDEASYLYALYPRMGGRNFDAERDEDWHRLGALVARCHVAGRIRSALSRVICHPRHVAYTYVGLIEQTGVLHPEIADRFVGLCHTIIDKTAPLFDDIATTRIHGDCHRGNILDRPDTGLLVIDFDDMMNGPAVQDLWLLLPDYAHLCRRELYLLIDGYEEFLPFDRREVRLIEALRFIRMIYFLAWQTRQRDDRAFLEHFPGWGSKAFWEREIEDLSLQYRMIDEHPDPLTTGSTDR